MERTTDHSCEAKLTTVKLYLEFHVFYRTYYLIHIHSPRNHLEFRTGRVFTHGSFAQKFEKERQASGSGEGGKIFHANEPTRRLISYKSRLQTSINYVIFCLRYFTHFRSIMAAVNKVLINMFTASFEFFHKVMRNEY